LFAPDSGRLTVGGVDASRDPLGVRAQVGYLPESTALYPELRVEEYLSFRAGLMGMAAGGIQSAIKKTVDACGLGDVRRRLVSSLSRGYRQRVGLAAALVGDPALLILDEPTVGLDPVQQRAFRALLAELGGERTVLLSSHLMAEVDSTCDWLVMIAGGRLVASGGREEILGRSHPLAVVRVSDSDLERFEGLCRESGSIDSVVRERRTGVTFLMVKASADCKEPLKMVGELASHHGVALRELRQASSSLEEIFIQHAGAVDGDWSISSSEEPS
jgi:ABC-2 type transport system ATP-binding protein